MPKTADPVPAEDIDLLRKKAAFLDKLFTTYDCFYLTNGGIEWGYREGTTIGEISDDDTQAALIELYFMKGK
ncbi:MULTISPECIES: hypothetical protein [unclassified Bradyrhizobium]|uniref:hypothetical protein n=1 Tax=unclassified Bradyrhizobium TaxID=2631580 RepID=UPI0033918D13